MTYNYINYYNYFKNIKYSNSMSFADWYRRAKSLKY